MPPGPDSSHDLLLEILRDHLATDATDRNDGLTLRALNRRMTEHGDFDEKRHSEFDKRIRELETKAAKAEGQIDTGRFLLPPPGQLPTVTVNTGVRSKRPSHPILAGLVENPKAIIGLIALLTVLAHAVLKLLH
jgi:hypothetical protein